MTHDEYYENDEHDELSEYNENTTMTKENLRRGFNCPHCKRFTKVYRYKMGRHMVRKLYIAYEIKRDALTENKEGWFRLSDLAKFDTRTIEKTLSTGNFTYLRFWGFIEQQRDKKGRKTGMWRITQEGIDFALGKTSAPTHALVYAGACFGLDKKKTTDFRHAERKENAFDLKETINN
jgi:hypothetical protein